MFSPALNEIEIRGQIIGGHLNQKTDLFDRFKLLLNKLKIIQKAMTKSFSLKKTFFLIK